MLFVNLCIIILIFVYITDSSGAFDESGLGLLANSAISVAAATSVALKAKKRKQREGNASWDI